MLKFEDQEFVFVLMLGTQDLILLVWKVNPKLI